MPQLKRESIENIAENRGGKCISDELLKYKKDGHVPLDMELKWQCKQGHIFESNPRQIWQNKWCPYCNNSSRTENRFRQVLAKKLNRDFPVAFPDWLTNGGGHKMELDGYCEELGLAFEYQGIHHFSHKFYKGSNNDEEKMRLKLKRTQRNDELKKKLCEEYGVILLCPTHRLQRKDFEDFIVEQLKDTRLAEYVKND